MCRRAYLGHGSSIAACIVSNRLDLRESAPCGVLIAVIAYRMPRVSLRQSIYFQLFGLTLFVTTSYYLRRWIDARVALIFIISESQVMAKQHEQTKCLPDFGTCLCTRWSPGHVADPHVCQTCSPARCSRCLPTLRVFVFVLFYPNRFFGSDHHCSVCSCDGRG